jgi:hypothetical protein
MNRWVVLVLAFLGCVIAGAAAAQDTGGTLAGRTVDAQGLPLPGVAVTVTGAQGARTAVSDCRVSRRWIGEISKCDSVNASTSR